MRNYRSAHPRCAVRAWRHHASPLLLRPVGSHRALDWPRLTQARGSVLRAEHGTCVRDHTARVIAPTGRTWRPRWLARWGTLRLSGPLHGGAAGRALDTLDVIGSRDCIDPWIRQHVLAGDRMMGFGHPVYRIEDPRSRMLRCIAEQFGGPLVNFAIEVEQRVEAILLELKPGRELHTNVEFYAGVVMELCGLPRQMCTLTFAAARVIGWGANILEQAEDSKIIRPMAR
ncbi:citrate/2-methylcitrate synthase [Streptomyces sp. cg40]|uniref:citrate/2-methylcitrate synthase n=1 Tax=Streptomyces sp. cg40 TaxID=3419764 RepID=UPI003CFD3163